MAKKYQKLLLLVTGIFLCLFLFNWIFNEYNNSCTSKLKFKIKELKSDGNGVLDLSNFDCINWEDLVIVGPYFRNKDLNVIGIEKLPLKMKFERLNENYHHLLFLNSNKQLQIYLPILISDIDFSKIITCKDSCNTIKKKHATFKVFTSNQRVNRSSDKLIVRAEFLEY